MNPYASAAYAATLPHLGTPVALRGAGTHVFVREAPGGAIDAAGAYPLLACERWEALAGDLAGLHAATGAVAFVGVTDPLSEGSPALLAATFPDRCVPFKEHQVVDLDPSFPDRIHPDHRRRARKAAGAVEVVAGGSIAEWASLYDGLRRRHGIRGGGADVPPSAWPGLLAHPALRVWSARRGGEAVAMALWFVGDGVAWYHLGASSPAGYEVGASYALFRHAFDALAAEGVARVDLGGPAGAAQVDDGLTRFKRRWGGRPVTAHLVGRILDPAAYARLAHGRPTTWFPAYRAPAGAAA